MILYYVLALCTLAVSCVFHLEALSLNSASVVPLVLIAVSVLQIVVFKEQEAEDRIQNTTYSTREPDHAAIKQGLRYHAAAKLAVIPLFCPFVLYFDTVWKIVVPIGIYLFSFFVSPVLLKMFPNRRHEP